MRGLGLLSLSGGAGVTLEESWGCVGIQIGRCHIQVVLEVGHTGTGKDVEQID